jgi:hypothetical protein
MTPAGDAPWIPLLEQLWAAAKPGAVFIFREPNRRAEKALLQHFAGVGAPQRDAGQWRGSVGVDVDAGSWAWSEGTDYWHLPGGGLIALKQTGESYLAG